MSNGDNSVAVAALNSEPFWNYWLRQSPFLALAVIVLYFVLFRMVEPTQTKNLELMERHAESNAKNAAANVLNAETNAKNSEINRQNAEQLKGQSMILEDIRAHVKRPQSS